MERIVVADDSATARMFVRRCLQISGVGDAEIVEAGNGREALKLLKEAPSDLLVTDLIMPDMDGLELLRHVAASPRLNGIPVLVISSSTNPAVAEQLKQLGAVAVLAKPISPAAVAEVLETITGGKDTGGSGWGA